MNAQHRVAVDIDPPSYHYFEDRLFDLNDVFASAGGDDYHRVYTHLRDYFQSRRIPIRTADYLPEKEIDGVLNVYVSMGMFRDFRQLSRRRDVVMSAFFASECPIVEPSLYRSLTRVKQYFKRIYSWSDSASLRRFLTSDLALNSYRIPQAYDDVHQQIWRNSDRQFLVMINKNKLPKLYWQELYTERLRAVEFFSRTDEIDLYGKGWDGPPWLLGKSWVPWTIRRIHNGLRNQWQRIRPDPLLAACQRVYKGPAESKAETLGNYKFAICFENMILKGWFTEKPFDCFFAGTIPIYWGPPETPDVIPSDCYIDMTKFESYEALREHLHSLNQDDIDQYKQNARQYLRSPQFRQFSKDAFAELFAEIIEQDTGVNVSSEVADPAC